MKRTQLLHGRFLLINSPNVSRSGTHVKMAGQSRQLLGRTDCIYVHASVILIANPPANADIMSVLLDEPAESHALNAAGNKPAARHQSAAQALDSEAPRSRGLLTAS